MARNVNTKDQFLIPMRGNELRRHPVRRLNLNLLFLIPMRGNERRDFFTREPPGRVPDPHEG